MLLLTVEIKQPVVYAAGREESMTEPVQDAAAQEEEEGSAQKTESVYTEDDIEEIKLSEPQNEIVPEKEIQDVQNEESKAPITDTENKAAEPEAEEGSTNEKIQDEEQVQIIDSGVIVNPVYEDIIDKAQLEAELEQVPTSADLQIYQTRNAAEDRYDNIDAAAEYLRGQMVLREGTVTFSVSIDLYDDTFYKRVVDEAAKHTENSRGCEGDSIQYGYKGYKVTAARYTSYCKFTYTFTYYTTHEQEQDLTSKVNIALGGLALGGKTEYEKICLIYDYICDNVDYDRENLNNPNNFTKYSAYAALCQGKAVCQGYAILFYRMCRESGLSVRIISGLGNGGNHAWNIVKIGSLYYNVDSTWDGQDKITTHNWFLLNEVDFAKHTRDEKYTSEEFNAAYPMADKSYGKQEKEPLNLENLSKTFKTLEDKTVSSTAEGKPKLLIFYQNICGNSQFTIKELSGNIANFSGVDIYAIEINKETKDSVSTFKATYGCDEITFSYDTGEGNNSSLWSYLQAIGLGNSISLPVLCYIDANNKLQYGETSAVSAAKVLENLKFYCGYKVPTPPVEEYTITYILDGGINNSKNPSIYTSKTETIQLQDATRSGYKFDGWYRDISYTSKVTQIAKGSNGNLILYAKWSPLQQAGKPEIDIIPAEGNIVIGFSGAYYTETEEKILKRLNEIRLEACQEGFINPSTGAALTMADYIPLQWSSDMEAIARLRAAEATISQSHTRPNGKGCFTVITTNREQSWAENLAWNYSGVMQGIEQWYAEKEDWVNKTGKETGHYTSIINPDFRAIGIGAFRLSVGGWYAVAQEFSSKTTLNMQKDSSQGDCVQPIEVAGNSIAKLEFTDGASFLANEGETYQLPLAVTSGQLFGTFLEGGTWTSSDETVASADTKGKLSAKAKGTAVISVKAGNVSASITVTVYGKGENPVQLTYPVKTTYKVGEQLDTTGGKITHPSESGSKTTDITTAMTRGFDSAKPGICKVTVTCDKYTASFDTLIIEEPNLIAQGGQTLAQVPLPENEYGVYEWADKTKKVESAGVYTFQAVFTPKDTQHFQIRRDLEAKVTVQVSLEGNAAIAFHGNNFIYNGAEQKPQITVSVKAAVLKENKDYTLSYRNNKDAGTAEVTVKGNGLYSGNIKAEFTINPAPLLIRAKDKNLVIGEKIPQTYEYEIEGLVPGEALVVLPNLHCDIESTEKPGRYEIVPSGADAGRNYVISYENGTLSVAEELVSCRVSFDVQGHGVAPEDYIGIKVGSTIIQPETPTESGYRFGGWYHDAACTKAWDFSTEIVQSDLTLYAKWIMEGSGSGLSLQEISDVSYTGKACKPAFNVYDGETLLKEGRDYSVKYVNNINVNQDGLKKKGSGTGQNFNEKLPYVIVTGKGNYKDILKINFNILPASIGDGGETPAKAVTLKYNDQMPQNQSKALKPFQSIKYVKAMKQNIDFMLKLIAENVRDSSGLQVKEGTVLEDAVIPAGYEGEFLLKVEGKGNYTGSISKKIYVTDSEHLLKNAKITLGKKIKNIQYQGQPISLKPATKNAEDVFTVKIGETTLSYPRDYQISYRGNNQAGKAELIITGAEGSRYKGSKTAVFNITGKSFTPKTVTVEGIKESVSYTGKAQVQNNVTLIYAKGTTEERKLTYGADYTISYVHNINKGTAVMTFQGIEGSGYSGNLKKKFKINAADLSDLSQVKQSTKMGGIIVGYSAEGAKPVEEVVLINAQGTILQNNRDYTLRYKNNKAVAKASSAKPPTIIVKGKGNYIGTLSIPFTIEKGKLDNMDRIVIKTTAISYAENKAPEYTYKPAVKLLDGKKALRSGRDYQIEYVKNTQSDYEAYLQKCEIGQAAESDMPRAVITAIKDGNYTLEKPIIVPLPIYCIKFTKQNLDIELEEMVYTGEQATPKATVYFIGENGKVKLNEGTDYMVDYGTNIKSGKNKGSISITGLAPYYGKTVTMKFDIEGKKISF